jgi:hypothetical protein
MRLYLHIGTEKTGTQTIQKFLVENRNHLRRQGYSLLESPGSLNARKLVACCQDEAEFDDFFKDHQISDAAGKHEFRSKFLKAFESEITELRPHVQAVVMSSEHFHSRLRSTESIAKLKELINRYFDALTIICYFREQSQVVQGLYSTAVKSGFTGNYSTFEQNCKPENHYYNYLGLFSKWGDIFGTDCLRASIYDPEKFAVTDLCTDFCQLAGISMAGLTPSLLRANESLGTMGIEAGRLINQAFPRYASDGSVNRLRIELMQEMERTPIARHGQQQSPQRLAIYERFDESNREFAKRFLGTHENPFARPEASGRQDALEDITVAGSEVAGLVAVLLGVMARVPRFTGQDLALIANVAESFQQAGHSRPAMALMDLAVRASGHNQALAQRLAGYQAKAREAEPKAPAQP